MKLFRFMSKEEFRKYINGEILINTKDHSKEGHNKTISKGFCFFNYAQYKPEEMLHSVVGIVNLDICCIFETEGKNVKRSYGRYSKAKKKDGIERISIFAKEFCTTEYSKNTFKLLQFAIPNYFNWDKWNWKEVK